MNSHKNATRKKNDTGITVTFKLNVPGFGAVLGTKDKNYRETFQSLQENVLQYVIANYNKGVNLTPLIRKLEYMGLSRK